MICGLLLPTNRLAIQIIAHQITLALRIVSFGNVLFAGVHKRVFSHSEFEPSTDYEEKVYIHIDVSDV